ncbi:MAG: FmdB family zinc ribbon protein [Candidatus Thorarchaeota archaeon]|jgi:putative FmdB family regulatory protein
MPRYRYGCESCGEEFMAFHSISDSLDVCQLCGEENVKKMVGKPIVIKKKVEASKATGELTKDYIEANRELLKEMKEEAKNGHYD